MQHDPEFDDPEFQAQWRHWRGKFEENTLDAYTSFDVAAALGAEARESEEGGIFEALPKSLIDSLQVAQTDPEQMVRSVYALHVAGLWTIVEILETHWRESQP